MKRAPVIALAVLVPFGVHARSLSHTSARLVWVRVPGAESYPDHAQMVSEVTRRLGYDSFTTSPTRTLDVIAEHTESG